MLSTCGVFIVYMLSTHGVFVVYMLYLCCLHVMWCLCCLHVVYMLCTWLCCLHFQESQSLHVYVMYMLCTHHCVHVIMFYTLSCICHVLSCTCCHVHIVMYMLLCTCHLHVMYHRVHVFMSCTVVYMHVHHHVMYISAKSHSKVMWRTKSTNQKAPFIQISKKTLKLVRFHPKFFPTSFKDQSCWNNSAKNQMDRLKHTIHIIVWNA